MIFYLLLTGLQALFGFVYLLRILTTTQIIMIKIIIPSTIAVLKPALNISPTNSQELIETSSNNSAAKGKFDFFM
jgi:hypothetical protein